MELKPRCILLLLASLLCPSAVGERGQTPAPAVHQGKTVEQWFQEYVNSTSTRTPLSAGGSRSGELLRLGGDLEKQDPPWEAIGALGERAVPCLLRHLTSVASETNGAPNSAQVTDGVAFPAAGRARVWLERCQAVELIQRLGMAARSAAPVLFGLLKKGGQPDEAELCAALRSVRADADKVNTFLLALARQHRDAEVLRFAFRLGWSDPELARRFGRMLSASDATRQHDALVLLEASGGRATPALEAIIGALRDADGEVRYLAARALENIGKQATPEARRRIIAGLKHSLEDPNPMVSGIARRLVANSTEAASQPQRGN